MEPNRPQGRERHVSGTGKSVSRRGTGLNTGPVGDSGRPASSARSAGGRARSRSPMVGIVALLLVLLGGGGGLYGSGMLDGSDSSVQEPSAYTQPVSTPAPVQSTDGYGALTQQEQPAQSPYANLLEGGSSQGWEEPDNQEIPDTAVSEGQRDKYTKLRGNGKDTVTIMVYMCGTDLESRSGMASKDLQEMTRASISDNIRVLIYTGGCSQWRNTTVSSKVNQIYELSSRGLSLVVKDDGDKSMVKPETLSAFIRWCDTNYPADRRELILWDHGGGSVSGFGYDQKYPRSGSMNLSGINSALKDAGVQFDFIGFDACLMATMETALMLDPYADYLIASEETEPGIGWYYTDWLTALSRNPSMPTLDLGKRIVDDFVSNCAYSCAGQSATLSVVDLAELAAVAPQPMKEFSKSVSSLIQSGSYQQVSNARNGSQEFARSTVIDQIDLTHFALRLNTPEGRKLADAVRSAVKYNRTSSNIANAYGLSIYFPYRKASKVDAAVSTYKAIGMDESYTQCIREFASLEVSGQATSGSSGTPGYSLFGTGSPGNSGGSDLIGELLQSFLGGDYGSVPGLSSGGSDFLTGRSLSEEDTVRYLTEHHFDGSALSWSEKASGARVISLPEEQWALVEGLEQNLFVDDGEGYVDLGLDNVFSFDPDGDLLAPTELYWIAVNDQPVAYYHEFTLGSGDSAVISGRIPAMLNGERVDLLVSFDAEHPSGAITGARAVYADGETDTVAKAQIELEQGDVIDFLCDYYRYDGTYENSYYLGEPLVVDGALTVSDVLLQESGARLCYRFTDLYQQHYWTLPLYFG